MGFDLIVTNGIVVRIFSVFEFIIMFTFLATNSIDFRKELSSNIRSMLISFLCMRVSDFSKIIC